ALGMAGFVATRGTLLGVGAAAVAIVWVRGAFTTWQLGRAVLVITIALAGLAAVLVLTPLGARARGVASGAPIVDRALLYATAIDGFAGRPIRRCAPPGLRIAYPAERSPARTGSRARHVPLRHRALVLSTATAAVCVVGVAAGAVAFAANRDAWRAGVEDSVVASRAGELAVARDPGRATYWNRLGLALER